MCHQWFRARETLSCAQRAKEFGSLNVPYSHREFTNVPQRSTMSQGSASGPSFQCKPKQSLGLELNGSTPTESLLKEVFEMLSETSACDFLFKMDAATDVSVLTSPVQLRNGQIVDGISHIFEAEGEYRGMFNMKFECRWLIVPVLSFGQLTASIIVQSHESFRAANPCHHHKSMAVVRVIQNSSNGDMLLCVDEPADNLVTLMLFSRKSPAMRKRVLLRFKRDACLAALSVQWGPNFRDVSRALRLCKEFVEFYLCPSCNSTVSGTHCPCIAAVKRPTHPLDFSSISSNILHHCGTFSGYCSLILLSNGVRYAMARLPSSTSITRFFEPGLIRRVVEAGIRSKMGTRSRVTSILPSPMLAQAGSEAANIARSAYLDDSARLTNTAGITGDVTERVAIATTEAAPEIVPQFRSTGVFRGAEADHQTRRQIQNRVSVARSNLVRRQRWECLEQDLVAMRMTRRELEQRREELKAENAHLLQILKEQ